MKNASELLEEAVYAGNLSENEEKRLYSWIESLILAKRKYDEDEAKARAFNEIEYLQGKFDCGSEYRDFYSDVVKVIHRWQRGEFDE